MGLLNRLLGKRQAADPTPAQPSPPPPPPPDEPAVPHPNEISPEEVQRLLDGDNPPLLIDVREAPELQMEGWIPGSKHMPMSTFEGRESEIDPSRPVILHCAHGMRSWDVGCHLLQRGFADVSSMTGGIAAWNGPREAATGGR